MSLRRPDLAPGSLPGPPALPGSPARPGSLARTALPPRLPPLLLLTAGLVGCLHPMGPTDSPGHPATASATSRIAWHAPWQRPFPDSQTVERWAALPAPALAIGSGVQVVDSWTLSGPFPGHPGTTPWPIDASPDPWSAFLATRARGTGTAITEEMICTAREAGLFVLANGARPTDDLLDVMSSRCGALAVGLVATFAIRDDDGTRSQEQLFATWKPLLTSAIRLPRRRHQVAGIFFGRDRGRAAVVVVSGANRAEISAPPSRPDARGRRVIRGTLRAPATHARAAITIGRYRTAPCRLDPAVELPDFVMTCTPSRSDRRARIELIAFPPDQPYGVTALRLDIWPSASRNDSPDPDDPGGTDDRNTYRRVVYQSPRPLYPRDDLQAILRDTLNAIRADAGLSPLAIAPAQSRIATRLAPRYLAEAYGLTAPPGPAAPPSPSGQRAQGLDQDDRPPTREAIALGLMAGWKVAGSVYRSGLTTAVSGAPDASVLVGSMASNPFGRDVLFDPRAHFLALGAIMQDRVVASLVATYAVVEQVDRDAVVTRALATVERRRRERGLSSPGSLREADHAIRDVARRIESRRLDPDAAVSWLLSRVGDLRARNTWAWTLSVPGPGPFPFPHELFEPGRVRIAATLATYRPPGDPWASFVLILVVTSN